jgi:hypothetical protein
MSTTMSSDPSITRDRGDVRTSVSLTFGFGHAKAPGYSGTRYVPCFPGPGHVAQLQNFMDTVLTFLLDFPRKALRLLETQSRKCRVIAVFGTTDTISAVMGIFAFATIQVGGLLLKNEGMDDSIYVAVDYVRGCWDSDFGSRVRVQDI